MFVSDGPRWQCCKSEPQGPGYSHLLKECDASRPGSVAEGGIDGRGRLAPPSDARKASGAAWRHEANNQTPSVADRTSRAGRGLHAVEEIGGALPVPGHVEGIEDLVALPDQHGVPLDEIVEPHLVFADQLERCAAAAAQNTYIRF